MRSLCDEDSVCRFNVMAASTVYLCQPEFSVFALVVVQFVLLF